MRNIIKWCVLCLTIFSTLQIKAQETFICDNGGFESIPYINYTFKHETGKDNFSCVYNASSLTAYTSMASVLNTFSNPVTLVDTNGLISGGFDPTLEALNIDIPRVIENKYAIKLNAEVPDESVTVMTKSFTVNSPIVSYQYSLIAQNPVGVTTTSDLPHFIVNLYNSSNVILDSRCIVVDPNDSDDGLFSTGTSSADFLYSGWKCEELSTDEAEENEILRLEFIITDVSKTDLGFATVYIDDICNVPCCPECPEMTIDVGVSDHQDAEVCIEAYNTIGASATADYHAAFEVVLLPGTSSDPNAVPGFESLYGSDGYYHIAGCDGETEPEVRRNMNMDKPGIKETRLQIYPNPTNSELNIQAGDSSLKAISLMTLDGKVVFVKEVDEADIKDYRIDMAGMSQGIYILTVETRDGNTTVQKIIRE